MRQLKITPSITKKDSYSVDKYLSEIGKSDLLTQEEEIELAQKIRKGDKESLEKLVESNLRFVVSVAKQYQNQGMDLPDLINEGNIGLIKAAEKFDETKGFKFISYAVWWIRQSIQKSIQNYSKQIRIPQSQSLYINYYLQAKKELEQKLEREVDDKEVLQKHPEIPKEIPQISKQSYKSLNDPLEDKDNSKEISDLIKDNTFESPDEKISNKDYKREMINHYLNRLPEKNKKALEMYYGIGYKDEYNMKEISEELGVSKEQIGNYIKGGILRLRSKIT